MSLAWTGKSRWEKDGAPGSWDTGAEAMAAAEQAFSAWLEEAGDEARLALAAVAPPPPPLASGKRVRMTAKAIVISAVRSWGPFRRSGATRPAPSAETARAGDEPPPERSSG